MYYSELNEHFRSHPVFIEKEMEFERDIVPKFKVFKGINKEYATLCFKASAELTARDSQGDIGFELLGFDFMVDNDLNVKLLEVNQNPCLSTLSEGQEVLISKLLNDVFK